MIFYRAYEQRTYNGIQIRFLELPLIKETPCGYWIGDIEFTFMHDPISKRWVSKVAKKRYAYPTKYEAINSFIHRKQRQIEILKARLEQSETALLLAKNITTGGPQ